MTNATKNFEFVAAALYNEAPSDKARAFVEKVAAQIRAKGTEWLESHTTELHLHDTEVYQDVAPIEDNRLFYLGRWQMALLG